MAEPVFVGLPKRFVSVNVDGRDVDVIEGATILDACRRLSIDTPTLCQLDNLTPGNVCRVCVGEGEGARVLVPAGSREVEAGVEDQDDPERCRRQPRAVPEPPATAVLRFPLP